jgi:hypothetical protein
LVSDTLLPESEVDFSRGNEDVAVCVDGSWEYPPRNKSSADSENHSLLGKPALDGAPEETNSATWVSILTLLLSIPALIGGWCWPAIVLPLLGGIVTDASRALSHYVSFGVTVVFMIFLVLYTGHKAKKRAMRYPGCWKAYGGLVCVSVAALLIMAEPTRHVLQDMEIWNPPGSSMYQEDCDSETITCLNMVGWIFTIFCTYSGFFLLVVGTVLNADIHTKIQQKWRAIR